MRQESRFIGSTNHSKEIGLKREGNGESVKDFDQGSNRIDLHFRKFSSQGERWI